MVQPKCSKTDQQIPEFLSEPTKTQQQHSNKPPQQLQFGLQQQSETEDEQREGMVFQSCSNADKQISEIPAEPTEIKHSNEQQQQLELKQAQISIPVGEITKKHINSEEKQLPPELSSREKLKRHRTEVAGHVWIPDSWGQEDLLKNWIDSSAFESSISPTGIVLARAALIRKKTVGDI